MSNWEKNVRLVTPYTPGEQPKEKVIKLNTNENPYKPAKAVYDVLKNFDATDLRLYPDPSVTELIDALSDTYGVPIDQIFVGVGSDDVLAMSFMTFFNSERPVLFPDITYSFYDVWAEEFRIPYETKALDEDFHVVLSDYMAPNGGIVLPNPNAPTGIAEGIDFYEKIVEANPDSVVIIDEAYVDFGADSMLPLIDRYDNLLVVRTFSKSRSLAGSRIGYAFGSKKLIKYLNDVKYSFNSYTMDALTIKLGTAVLSEPDYFEETVDKIIDTREWFKSELKNLGFTFGDSKTNFVFATHKSVSAAELFEALKKNGIFVRYFNKPRIDNYLRITIGTREEMESLLSFFENYPGIK